MTEESEQDLQEVIDQVVGKNKKKKINKPKPKKETIISAMKEYQTLFLISAIAFIIVIILLIISYRTNPYIRERQEESMTQYEYDYRA